MTFNFSKPFMRKNELVKLGIPEAMLEHAYRTKGQTFARKANPMKDNSPIVFETEGFGKWWDRQVVR